MIDKVFEYQGLNTTFNITEDCNLRCSYCYEVTKKPKDLPLDYAKRFINLLLEDPDPILVMGTENEWMLNQGLIMDFIGGDALVRPELCDAILSYWIFRSGCIGHKWATRWRCSISSNGTLLDRPEVRKFLDKYEGLISLGISVDGCPEIHNRNRSNSMEKIMDSWSWYLDYRARSSIHPSTKATLNKDSIPFLFESLRFLHENMGLTYINMNFIFEDMKETEEDLAELERQMEKCIGYVLEHKSDIYWGMLDKSYIEGKRELDTGWCGSGAMPALSVNGRIYPCFRFLPHTMFSRDLDFSVGDVWTGFSRKENFKKVREQTRGRISTQECLNCPVEGGCAWCIGGAFSEAGRFYRQTNICKTHKIQAKWTEIYWKEYGNGSNNGRSV